MKRNLQSLNRRQKLCRWIFTRILADLKGGTIHLGDADGVHTLGSGAGEDGLTAEVTVLNPAFYCAAVWEQSSGVGRAFMSGWWVTEDLVNLIRIFARNEGVLRKWTAPTQGLLGLWHRFSFWLRRNSRTGARRNISEHYDLGEDFFAEFLDPSLTYSCAYFEDGDRDLAEAQEEKLDRVCRKLDLGPDDHVLEIGTGWGSFAIHAARKYGCRVTTTTISAEQARFAADRIKRLGLANRIEVIQKDYRDLTGQYDKLVSLEMIEAVGVRYYPTYFRRCADLLTPQGAMLLQSITVDDRQFHHDSRHIDFIKRYIFPGGVLPSTSVIARTVAENTDFQMAHLEDMAAHYARTLHIWRQRFLAAESNLRAQGRNDEFLRCWEFYFAYCEGAFRERRVGAVQVLLTRPQCRQLPLLRVAQGAKEAGAGSFPRLMRGEAS